MGKSSIILTFLETAISDQDLKEQQKQPIFNFSCIKGAGMGYTLQGRNFYSEIRIIMYVQFCTVHLSMWKKKICLFVFHFYWLFSCWLMDHDASRRFSWFTNLFKQFISWVKGGQKVLTFSYSLICSQIWSEWKALKTYNEGRKFYIYDVRWRYIKCGNFFFLHQIFVHKLAK